MAHSAPAGLIVELDAAAALFLPALLVACAIEWAIGMALGRRVYGHRQTLNNVAVGIAARVFLSSIGMVPLLGYAWLRDRIGLFTWDMANPLHHALCFVVTDLGMWARHVAGHRVALLWALHGVHHQSREYNLSVAGRLSAFADTILFALPCAVLGFPTEMVLLWFLVGNFWMFFQHTELVGRLPVLDGLVMTPANHRVHHGCNEGYLDKNYGNLLLVWDRLFGTWVPETEPVRYGVLTGLRTYDGTENNVELLRLCWRKMGAQTRLRDALAVLFMPPGWVPGRGEVEPLMIDDPEPQRVPIEGALRVTSTLIVLGAMLVAMPLVANAGVWPWYTRFPLLALVLLLLATAGVLLDKRPVEPVPMPTRLGRARAMAAAWLLTLAGPDARGPLKRLGQWLQPFPGSAA